MSDGSFNTNRSEWVWVVIAALCIVALTSLPYVIVYLATPPDLRFVGTLLNPLDGDTYLAKMRFGAQGDWLFHLPYTAQDHPGAFILTHYLALGHVAAWTRLPIPLVYHLARVIAGLALLLAVYALVVRVTQDITERRIAFLFVALSSGLGWLAMLFGHQGTSDLFIPESNTFFSLHINPHFPLAAALMIGMFTAFIDLDGDGGFRMRLPSLWRLLALAAASVALAIVQPFAVVIVYATLGVYLILRWRRDGHIAWPWVWTAVIAGVVTLPLAGYTLWVTQADPVLRGWTAQNLTPSPPIWDYVLGYGLILALAVPGAILAARRRADADLMLLAWIGVTVIALYAPFALQRRFSLGLHIPLAILAAMGLCHSILPHIPEQRRKLGAGAMLAATLPTTMLVLMIALGAGLKHDPKLFVSADEAAGMDWLREHAPRDAVVLSSPEMGLFIPAWSGRRVVYGHPFETVDAQRMKGSVEEFFSAGEHPDAQVRFMLDWNVAFLFVGPRERTLGFSAVPSEAAVFRNATVTIYQETP